MTSVKAWSIKRSNGNGRVVEYGPERRFETDLGFGLTIVPAISGQALVKPVATNQVNVHEDDGDWDDWDDLESDDFDDDFDEDFDDDNFSGDYDNDFDHGPDDFGDEHRPDDSSKFISTLHGLSMVPPVLSLAWGTFEAQLSHDGQSIDFTLAVSELSAPVTKACLYFAPATGTGAPIALLVGDDEELSSLPDNEWMYTGTLSAEHLLPAASQGVAGGDVSAVVSIMRRGLAYVSVSNDLFPDGEVRGQIKPQTY